MRDFQFLRNVSVLANLSDELLGRLAGQLGEVNVRAGEFIMRAGEPADSMFLIRSGRVEVIDEGPPETLIRVLRRGDVLGELALLHLGTRSASARARRDAELLELGRGPFEAMMLEAPGFALGLTRALGAQLAASRTPTAVATPVRTITVVGLDAEAPTAEVARSLSRSLRRHGSVAELASGDVAAIDTAMRDAERVVLRAQAQPADEWTKLCVREADLVVAVTTGRPDSRWLARAASLRSCELLVVGSGVTDAAVARLQPRAVQVVTTNVERRRRALDATARRIAGRSLGVVLSGGGARALAHIGVLEELHARNVQFDRIAGVSLGSLVAAASAADFSVERIHEAMTRGFVETNPTNDFVPPAYSLVRGVKARTLLRDAFGDVRIEELPKHFYCLSCDLIARESVVHRFGPLVDALYPSFAIPGVFPPVAVDGRLLVDGGVLDNLPVATMARSGEGPVIAVDVTGRIGQDKRPRHGPTRIRSLVQRALTGGEAQIPRLGETMLRTLTVGSSDTVAAARIHADIVITPAVDGVGMMDWKALEQVRALGRQAAREALNAHAELLAQTGN